MTASPQIAIFRGRTPVLKGAEARVVVDVLRAFTTTHIALDKGARRILLADTLECARRLAASGRRRLLAGERNAVAPEGFDFGNSPAEFDDADLKDRDLVLTTSNGVQAVYHATFDGPVFVTGFTNAGATVGALRRLVSDGARRIELIASHPRGDEDLACAQWIRARLLGQQKPDDDEVLRRIRHSQAARKFLDPDRREYRAADVDYCARRADTPWAMVVHSRPEAPTVERCEWTLDP